MGTIAAVLIALFAPQISAAFERRTQVRRTNARSIGLVRRLKAPFHALDLEVTRVEQCLASAKDELPVDSVLRSFWIKKLLIRMEPPIEFIEQQVADTNDTYVGALRECGRAIVEYNSVLGSYAAADSPLNDQIWAALQAQLLADMVNVRRCLGRAQTLISRWS